MSWSEYLSVVSELFSNFDLEGSVFENRKELIKKHWSKGKLSPEECFDLVFDDLI
jgi:hypothetical protein